MGERTGTDMIYVTLFLSFCQIGLFSFGGGYAAMPLIQHQVIDLHHWLTVKEFSDLVTISQMTPGPIAINAATFVGLRIAGPLGAAAATIGCVFPSCVIVTFIAYFYMKYRHMDMLQKVLNTLRPAVIALIAAAGLTIIAAAFWGEEQGISLNGMSIPMVIIFIICLFLMLKKRVNPIVVMILAGGMRIVQGLLF